LRGVGKSIFTAVLLAGDAKWRIAFFVTHLTVSMQTLNPGNGNGKRRKRRSRRKLNSKARVASCLDATFHAAYSKPAKCWANEIGSVYRQNHVPTLYRLLPGAAESARR
jgi:hypothetical protein